jgi:radical SAM protein with 4Fe4S-binding SPASM domain
MINITRLYCGAATGGDALRYGVKTAVPARGASQDETPTTAAERKPVTVWNATRTCNLSCVHCYSDSYNKKYDGELTGAEAKAMIDDLAAFEVPALLLSGGEPLIRKDLFEVAGYAAHKGLKCTLSTNGTLITENVARRIKEAGFSYVGISLDGMGEVNDKFRGQPGAFEKAMRGLRNCVEIGQRVGLRLTLTKRNAADLHAIFDFIENEGINRACFYHLVYAGRGSDMLRDDLQREEKRRAMDVILERAADFHRRGLDKEILTVDNHCDGVYIYLKLRERDPARAEDVLELIEWNGGGNFSSGVGLADIDFFGNVHPDQFWTHHSFGNIRERPFSEIWTDASDPLMAGLRNRKHLLKGRCGACKWKDACGGSFRVRAEAVYGDPWAQDPACYLSDEEIGMT